MGANLHPLPRDRVGVLATLRLDRDALDEHDLFVHSTDEDAGVLRMHLVADALDLVVSNTRDEGHRGRTEEWMESRPPVMTVQRGDIRDACEVRLGIHTFVSARSPRNPRAEGPAAYGPFGMGTSSIGDHKVGKR